VTWKQFQLGITAVFTANVAITLLVFFADSRSTNTNTNIVNTPHEELRSRLAQQFLKDISNGVRSGTNSTGERSSGTGPVDGD
jgi:hypothetical protein